ncbi:hypothetical protein DOCECA_12785 [Pseudomonas sp. E102]
MQSEPMDTMFSIHLAVEIALDQIRFRKSGCYSLISLSPEFLPFSSHNREIRGKCRASHAE